jgi:hypothetical protein
MLEECSKSVRKIEGRPCDEWMMGFVWAMAWGWKLLTTLPITPCGYFTTFLEQGFDLLRPDEDPPEWESLVKTATKRFCLKDEKPPVSGGETHA